MCPRPSARTTDGSVGATDADATVLVVSGDRERREACRSGLEAHLPAFGVATAPEAAAALGRVATGDVDCVVSDYDLPGTDGVAFLEAVRDRRADLPFVLHAGDGSERVASDAIAAGVTDYVPRDPAADYGALAARVEAAVADWRDARGQDRDRALLRDVAATVPERVFVTDADGDVLYGNAAFVATWGRPQASIHDEGGLLARVHPHDREAVRADLRDVYDDATEGTLRDGYRLEFRLAQDGEFARGAATESDDRPTPSDDRPAGDGEGAARWLRLTLTPASGGGGERLVGVATDVTEYRRRLAASRRNEEKFRGITETSNDIIFRFDLAGRITYVSPAVESITGYRPPEVEGELFHEFVADEEVPDALQQFERVVAGEAATGLAFDLVAATGERVPVEVNATPIFDGDAVVGAQGVARDVTERREREADLRQYETIVETVPDGVFLLDEAGRLAAGNDTGAELLGYEREDLRGRPFTDLVEAGVFGEESVEKYAEAVRDLLSSSTDASRARYELEATVDGERRVFEVHIALRPFEESFRGTIGVIRDVTERLRYEQALEDQNERLERFAHILSHDIRTPLNVAMGRLELARDERDSDRLAGVADAHARIEDLIESVLRLAREGEGVGELVPVALDDVARAAWRNVDTAEATLSVAGRLGTRAADRDRLASLFENLFRNAVEHGGADVSVEVGATTDGFYVADDGPGIPPAERERAFDFGHTTAADGTGFGLAIVREVAEAHGWSVRATEADGGGARFEVRAEEQ